MLQPINLRTASAALLLAVGLAGCGQVAVEEAVATAESPEAISTPEPTVTPEPTPTSATPVSGAEFWRPQPGTSWQWQLEGLPVDLSIDVDMYDIDLFENDSGVVQAVQERGIKVVCYVSAGSWENWRPDADAFPDEAIGSGLADWEGEKWLDIRRLDVLGPIMEARLDLCKAKSFDAVEPDNVDGYLNETGFPLTYEDQITYNIWLAKTAHARGLSIGLKNDGDQIPDLLSHFDWALNEECFEFEDCGALSPFIESGKAVFNVEYGLDTGEFCIRANALGFSSMKKNLNLDAHREPCP